MKFALCVILLPLVTSLRLTRREDRELRKTCGKHFLDGFHFKAFRGKPVSPKEYPWLVTLYYDDNGDQSKCTGAVISPRHILTAAHCITKGTEGIGTPEGCRDYRNVRKLNSKHTWISDRMECPVPKYGQRCKKHLAEVRIVYPGYNECTKENDLAVLEMSSNLPRSHLVPICMPKPGEKLSPALKAAGSGLIQPLQRGRALDGYNAVNMTILAENNNLLGKRIITQTNGDASLCGGDSGGPLFQSDAHDIHTLVGIQSISNGCNDEIKAKPRFFFNLSTDVRKYLRWICKVTGVCYSIFDYKNYEERRG